MARKKFVWLTFPAVVASSLAFSCVKKPGGSVEKPVATQVSKLAGLPGKLPVDPQAPIAPNHALVLLTILKIYPEEASGEPCSKTPCKAEAQVLQVQGYGSSFGSPLIDGQKVQVYFPMTIRPGGERSEVRAGSQLQAELRSPLVSSDFFTIKKYSLR